MCVRVVNRKETIRQIDTTFVDDTETENEDDSRRMLLLLLPDLSILTSRGSWGEKHRQSSLLFTSTDEVRFSPTS